MRTMQHSPVASRRETGMDGGEEHLLQGEKSEPVSHSRCPSVSPGHLNFISLGLNRQSSCSIWSLAHVRNVAEAIPLARSGPALGL